MKKKSDGFTLIELMIVVAIVGILASIALPAYQDYMIKARVTEGLAIAEMAKYEIMTDVSSLVDLNVISNNWNSQDTHNGVAATSKYVDSIIINSTTGVVLVDFNHANVGVGATSDQLTFTPSVHTGSGTLTLVQSIALGDRGAVDWACASSSNLTATVRNLYFTVPAEPILAKYVPAECR